MNKMKPLFIVPVIAVLLGAIPSVFAQSQSASPGLNPTCGKAMINGTITAFCAQPANVLLLCADGSTPDATGYCGTQTQTQSQSFVGTDFGDFSNLAKIPIIGGLIASQSMKTGILHNEQGVFISWSTICNKGQAFILQSCNTLIDSNGNLTPQGDTAVGCIRNGLAAAIYAQKHGISLDLAKSVLNFAASLTGCSGIVNLDTIQNEPQFQNLLNIKATNAAPSNATSAAPSANKTALQEPAVGQSFVGQGTKSSQISPLPGHANEYVAAVLIPRSDSAVYSGVLKFTASSAVNVEVWNIVDKNTAGMVSYNGLPIIFTDMSPPNTSASVPFSANAVLLKSTSPFTMTYTVNAIVR